MPTDQMVMALSGSNSLLVITDAIGIVIGLVSLLSIAQLKNSLGGRIGNTLNLLLAGIIFMILAFVWTFLSFLNAVAFAPIETHHILMIIGTILLVLAARSLGNIVKP